MTERGRGLALAPVGTHADRQAPLPTDARPQGSRHSAPPLVRRLHLMLWVIPALMAFTGIAFTLFDSARHGDEAGSPWPTVLGIVVLGLLGPALSWVSLRWAIRTADAYVDSERQLADRSEQLAALNALALEASRSLDLDKTMATALEQMMKTLDAEAGMIFLPLDDHSGLRLKAHRGISVAMAEQEARLEPGHCLCGQAANTRQVLFAADVSRDARCTSDLCGGEGMRSVVCAPLEVSGRLVGLLQLASPLVGHFTDAQHDFIGAMARQISVSVENARFHDTVRAFNVDLERKVNQRTRELESARWALAEKARQLRRLLSESYRIQEDTQARIAHDMHDGVTQMIIGALYETQAARQALSGDPARAAESLTRAQRLLTEVEVEIRHVILDLHPPVLDAMGLVVALRRFAATFTAAFNIDCEIQVVGPSRRLPKEIEIAVYRIIQAALHNVATHAQAGRALVDFDFGTDWLQVRIEDDGIGFDPKPALNAPGEHLGLIGMKERAEGLGAELIVDSAAGKGTRIELRLPSPASANGE
jgi:signal transduction histidine kinase